MTDDRTGRLDSAQYAAELLAVTGASPDPATSLCTLALETLDLSGVGLGLSRIRAAFGFPLVSAGACFGTMNLYRTAPGALTREEHADALVVTEVSGALVLTWPAAAAADRLAWQLDRVPEGRVQIHQAVGRISAQANVPIADALVSLRACAFAHDRPVLDVAREVANGNLRLV